MKILFFSILILLSTTKLHSATFIDTVYSFLPGTVQNSGQSSEYFPMNIFGAPAANATWTIPASSPDDLCSIGIGGEIVVGLKNGKILNGEGPDFIIFENAFERIFDGKIFAEPAVVSVSSNGLDFVEFPYNEWTLEGLAGKTPTNGNANPFDYAAAGGDAFDLQDLSIDFVTHIKIRDVSRIVSNDTEHPYYQPEFMVTGFDLDAVAILYPQVNTSVFDSKIEGIRIEESPLSIFIYSQWQANVSLYSIQGMCLLSAESNGFMRIDKTAFPHGVYILMIENNGKVDYSRVLISP